MEPFGKAARFDPVLSPEALRPAVKEVKLSCIIQKP